MEISLFSISLCIHASSFWMLIQLIVYSVFITLVVFPQDALAWFVSEWSSCTFINVLTPNHIIKLVNTGASTCHSTLDRWTIGIKRWDLNRCQTRLHAGSKIIYRKYVDAWASIWIYMVCTTYSRVGPGILGPAESSVPWICCYLQMMLN